MNLLLDTHTVVWFLNGDKSISTKVKLNIESSENRKYISIASLWEIAIKYNIGKFNYPLGLDKFFDLVITNGFRILPINMKHILKLSTIEKIHKDPFDRIIIAQALIDEMIICTIDEKISMYNVDILW